MKLSDALELLDSDEDDSTHRKECLITRQEIKHGIVMKCNHTFEYEALLKQLLSSQHRYDYHKCPYCRKVFSNFIPYFQTNETEMGKELLDKINKNIFKKNDYFTCSYCFISGKNKNKCCGKVGHNFKEGRYCFTHYKQVSKKHEGNSDNKLQCCKILKNGNQCKLKCYDVKTGLCKRHGEK